MFDNALTLKQFEQAANNLVHRPIYLTTSIGFDGATASQRLTVYTPNQDYDVILYGANVNFSNALVTVKILDTAEGYTWNTTATPIVAIAGVTTQAMPILMMPVPYLLRRQSKLQMEFTNSASALTTGGIITWVGSRLSEN